MPFGSTALLSHKKDLFPPQEDPRSAPSLQSRRSSAPLDVEEHHPVVHRLKYIESPVPPPEGKGDSSDSDDKENGFKYHQVSENSSASKVSRKPDSERPPFKRHHEATPIELFYDLFFVANLNAFTEYHSVTTNEALADYVGFFGILWLTWFQTGLYDVRFSWDSMVDRVWKAFHFGFMVGFAPIGASFFPASNNVDGHALAILLMGSRFILFLQYAMTTFQTWDYMKTRLPMIATTAVYFVSAFIYLGIAFAFPANARDPGTSDAYIAFYVVGGAEALLALGIPAIWRSISFKGTHLVERLGLLTLIILGEGIIVLCKACIIVWKETTARPASSDFPLVTTSSTPNVDIALVLSAVLIIYFTYQLYFDTQANEHFGTIKQKLYALVHFPVHIGLALFVIGVAECLRFRQAITDLNVVVNSFTRIDLASRVFGAAQVSLEALYQTIEAVNSTSYFETAASQMNATAQQLSSFLGSEAVNLEAVNQIAEGATLDAREVAVAVYELLLGPVGSVFEGVELATDFKPDPNAPELLNSSREILAYASLFDLTFIYTYVAGGVAILLIGLIWWISKTTEHTRFDYVRMAVWMATGLTLALLALLDLTAEKHVNPGEGFLDSDWLLPTILFILSFNLFTFHLPFGRHGAIVSGDY